MKIKIAFYKYNKITLNALISLWTWPFNPFTPPVSHCELGVEMTDGWEYFSSTLRGGAKGTRWIDKVNLFKNPDRWEIYMFEVESVEDIISRANGILGQPYDFAGLTGFVTPFGLPNDKKKWYCSEACYFVLTGIWKRRISPRKLYTYVKRNYKDSIRRV